MTADQDAGVNAHPATMSAAAFADHLDTALAEHHNGYDGFACVTCGADWYHDDGHHHLTQIALRVLRGRPVTGQP